MGHFPPPGHFPPDRLFDGEWFSIFFRPWTLVEVLTAGPWTSCWDISETTHAHLKHICGLHLFFPVLVVWTANCVLNRKHVRKVTHLKTCKVQIMQWFRQWFVKPVNVVIELPRATTQKSTARIVHKITTAIEVQSLGGGNYLFLNITMVRSIGSMHMHTDSNGGPFLELARIPQGSSILQ